MKNMSIKGFRIKKKSSYSGSTLVEALIAIVVAGIASAVLMKISGDVIQELVITEKEDALTQLAYETSIVIRRIANVHNASEDNLPPFPIKDEDIGYCYAVRGDFASPIVEFVSSGVNPLRICVNDDRWNACKNSNETYIPLNITNVNSKLISDDGFRFFCIYKYDPQTQIASGTVVVGTKNCAKKDESKSFCLYKYNISVYVKAQ